MSSSRALLRHVWAMVQTRAEAAALVVQLQRTAVTHGLVFGAIAAVTALSFMTAVIVWIAVAAPEAWRGWALGFVALALLATAVYSVLSASRSIRRDANLIADFSQGLKLDLAMVNLALKDPDTEDEEKLAARERAKTAVREAAAEKSATPSTAEGGRTPSPQGPTMESAAAAMRAAAPRPEVKQPGAQGAARPAPAASLSPVGSSTPGTTPDATGSARSSAVGHREPAAWGVGIAPGAAPATSPAPDVAATAKSSFTTPTTGPSVRGFTGPDVATPVDGTPTVRKVATPAPKGAAGRSGNAEEREREMPDPLLSPDGSELGASARENANTDRKQSHGSA